MVGIIKRVEMVMRNIKWKTTHDLKIKYQMLSVDKWSATVTLQTKGLTHCARTWPSPHYVSGARLEVPCWLKCCLDRAGQSIPWKVSFFKIPQSFIALVLIILCILEMMIKARHDGTYLQCQLLERLRQIT